MSILSIQRDWSGVPAIVRIESSDDYAAISAAGYLTTQAASIALVNVGGFQWLPTDLVAVTYVNDQMNIAWGLFSISSDMTSLIPFTTEQNVLPSVLVTMSAAQVNGAYAAPVSIISAPGAGNAILILSCNTITEVSTVFAGGDVAIVQYGNTVHGGGTLAIDATTPAAEITAAASQIYTQYGLLTTTASTGITNKGIYWSNQTGAFTGGAGSTVSLAITYIIVPALV